MPLTAPVVFPLLPIIQTPDGPACKCAAGLKCGRIGKHPAVMWGGYGGLKLGDPVPRPEPGAGAAIKTGARPHGSGVFFVDLDGPDAMARWEEAGGDYETYVVQSGREEGGVQLGYLHPGFLVQQSVGEFLRREGEKSSKIDIKGDGNFVVAAGSPHKSGRKYEVLDDRLPVSAPIFLLDWLKKQNVAGGGVGGREVQVFDGDVTDPELRATRREEYARYLADEATPLTSAFAGKRDAMLFEVIQYGAYDLALPEEDVYAAIMEVYVPRCDPDEDIESKILHKCRFAKESSTRPRRVPLSASENAFLDGLGSGGGSGSKASYTAAGAPGEAILPGSALVPKVKAEDAPDAGFRIRWGGWSARPKDPVFLVQDVLIQNKVAMIYADPGSVKTWLGIDIALSVATGGHWLGIHATQKGRAVFMDYEDGEEEFHRRVNLLAQGMGPTASDAPDLGYMYHPGHLDDPKIWARLRDLHKQKPFRLLVIDTLWAANGIKEENDSKAAVLLAHAGTFTEMRAQSEMPPSVLVIHHSNKAGGARGTSAFKGAVDVMFKLETCGEGTDEHKHRVTMICEKSGYKKVSPIRLELTDDGLRTWALEGGAKASDGAADLTDEEIRAKIMLALQAGDTIASRRKLRDLVKAKMNRVETELEELIAQGLVAKTDEGFVLDDDQRRTGRVISKVRQNDYWTSEAELAKASFVSTEFVHELKRRNVIARRASGRDFLGFVVLKNDVG